MNLQLQGKTVFITGSTAGIGFATAQSLAREGSNIILNGRNEEKLKAAIQKLQVAFPKTSVSGLATDFSKLNEVKELLDKLSYKGKSFSPSGLW